MNIILLYIGSALLVLWGIGHLIPTRNVVKDFGDISTNNKNILIMEWINEGVTLIFLGILTALVTYIDSTSLLAWYTYLSVIIFLVVLSLISLFSGFKVDFLPYKLCPVIFTASAVLILIGGIL
jgi:hypothetical protein